MKEHCYCSDDLPINNILQGISVATSPDPTARKVLQEVRSVFVSQTESLEERDHRAVMFLSVSINQAINQALCKEVQQL